MALNERRGTTKNNPRRFAVNTSCPPPPFDQTVAERVQEVNNDVHRILRQTVQSPGFHQLAVKAQSNIDVVSVPDSGIYSHIKYC
jgi:hypothetical protein